MTNRTFINGKLEGTRLEIMPSKPATHLPDGTPMYDAGAPSLNATQILAAAGELDLFEPQTYSLHNARTDTTQEYVGPSIAQEWKLLARGERPFYRKSNWEG